MLLKDSKHGPKIVTRSSHPFSYTEKVEFFQKIIIWYIYTKLYTDCKLLYEFKIF